MLADDSNRVGTGSQPQTRLGRYHPVLPVVSVAAVLFGGMLWWSYTIDDSYITYRYAENLAAGNGPVFNVGERAEGYSCPLWVFGLALTTWAGTDPLPVSKISGLGSAAALVVLLYVALRRCRCDPLIAGAACLWLAVLPGLHVHSCSGMETLPFALALAACAFIPSMRLSSRATAWFLPIGLAAAATLRPEGILVAGLLTPLWLFSRRQRGIQIGLVLTWLVLGALLAARYAYYGSVLPSTFYAKPSPVLVALGHGTLKLAAIRLTDSLANNLLPALDQTGGIGVGFLVLLSLWSSKTRSAAASAAIVCAAGCIFIAYAPTDWMPGQRFALPFAAPFLFLAALGADSLRGQLAKLAARAMRAGAVLTVFAWVLLSLASAGALWLEYRHGQVNTALDGDGYLRIGEWLRKNSRPDDRLLAYEVGAIAHGSGLYVIDHEGLVTEDIGAIIREAGGYLRVRWGVDKEAMNQVVRYCVGQRPDWFLVRSDTTLPLTSGRRVPRGVAREPIQNTLIDRFGSSMVLTKVFNMNPGNLASSDKYLLLRRQVAQDR